MKKLLTTAVLGSAVAISVLAADKPSRPNIIFILADDYGIPGVGCYGGDYRTPNLDALAAGGVRFEHCFAAPLCALSRALCMTGRYGFRTGVTDNPLGGKIRPQKEVCIAKMLKQAGYDTAVSGKWRQLSHFSTKADAQAWGFDEFLIWGVSFDKDKGDRYWDPDYNQNGQFLTEVKGKYGPDLLHEFAVDFIRRHRDGPFFLYYPTPLIHGPILRTPDSADDSANRQTLYADNIAYLDKLMGKLVAELDHLKLREKTLIVFTGDNGSVEEGNVHGRKIDGCKHQLKEGGSRVPLIINWKGVTPAGKVLKDLVDFTDFFPTFAELAGANLPSGVTIDGRSFASQLRGERGLPREWVFVQLGDNYYVRDARWKLTDAGKLRDLRDAPYQEIAVPADKAGGEAKDARERLQTALAKLNPIVDKPGAKSPKPAADKKKRKKSE